MPTATALLTWKSGYRDYLCSFGELSINKPSVSASMLHPFPPPQTELNIIFIALIPFKPCSLVLSHRVNQLTLLACLLHKLNKRTAIYNCKHHVACRLMITMQLFQFAFRYSTSTQTDSYQEMKCSSCSRTHSSR